MHIYGHGLHAKHVRSRFTLCDIKYCFAKWKIILPQVCSVRRRSIWSSPSSCCPLDAAPAGASESTLQLLLRLITDRHPLPSSSSTGVTSQYCNITECCYDVASSTVFFRDNLPPYIMSTGETSQYCNITERHQHGVGACHVPQRVQMTFFFL